MIYPRASVAEENLHIVWVIVKFIDLSDLPFSKQFNQNESYFRETGSPIKCSKRFALSGHFNTEMKSKRLALKKQWLFLWLLAVKHEAGY